MDADRPKRTLSRRAFLRAGLAGTGAAVLAACGAPSSGSSAVPATSPAAATSAPAAAAAGATTTAAPAAAAAEPTPTALPLPQGAAGKLTVIHRTEYFEAPQQLFRSTVEEFAKAQGIQLDISTANPEAFGDFMAKMQAAVQAGNPPDLSYHTLSVQQMHFLDIVEDVSDVVEEAIQKYGAVVPVTAEAEAKIDGKWYAVPFRSQADGWFARKDAFQGAGIDVTQLKTLGDFREACLKISDPAKQIWGWGITINKSGDGHGFITTTIQNFGGRFVDESGQKVTFNSPETVTAVKWLQETYSDPKYKPMLPPGIESWTDTSNNETFLAGKLGFTANAFTLYGKAKQDNNPIFPNIAVLHKPMTNDGTTRLETGASAWLSIFKGSKNIDAAKQTIRALLDPENFLPMVRGGGGLFLPAYKNLWTDEVLALDPNFPTLQEIIFNETAYTGQAYPAKPNPAIANIDAQGITSQMMANVLNGSMTAEQAVEDAHKKMVQIFEELDLPQS